MPTDPQLVSLHNNVKIASNVYFCTHDILNKMLNICPDYTKYLCGVSEFKEYSDEIEVYDNTFIGANSIIMYGVKIGPNALVAAGSIVTKDVPKGRIVGGNPAKIIGHLDDLAYKRADFSSRV